MWKNKTNFIVSTISILLILLGIALVVEPRQSIIIQLLLPILHRLPTPRMMKVVQWGGVAVICGAGFLAVLSLSERLRNRVIHSLHHSRVFIKAVLDRLMTRDRKINGWDIAILVIFLTFSGLYFLNRLIDYGFPLALFGGDASNIASFAAAFDNPANFQGDELLSNLNNIRIYNTVHIPLIRWLNQLTGNYGLAYQLLLWPTIFIQLLAFYYLGRAWFKSRYWAFLFSAISIIPVTTVVGEGWGLFQTPLPRFTFQALLPFTLALVWIWRSQPRRWPLIMFFCGLLVYVHPVSAPAWWAAVWFGFLVLLPADWKLGKRLAVMAGLAFVVVLVTLPFIISYLSYHVQGQIANYGLLIQVINENFPKDILNIPAVVVQFIKNSTQQGLLPLSIVGFFAVLWLAQEDRKKISLVLAWMGGLFLISLVVPYAERTIEKIYHLAPFETELVRGIRYYYFFLILFIIWALSECGRRLKGIIGLWMLRGLGLLLLVVYLWINPNPGLNFSHAFACMGQGKLVCRISKNAQLAQQLVEAVDGKTPVGARIYFSRMPGDTGTLFIRYLALRPLVYSYFDSGMLAYSNPEQLRLWHNVYEITSQYKSDVAWLNSDPDGFLKFVKAQKADFLILGGGVSAKLQLKTPLRILFQNEGYTLIDIR